MMFRSKRRNVETLRNLHLPSKSSMRKHFSELPEICLFCSCRYPRGYTPRLRRPRRKTTDDDELLHTARGALRISAGPIPPEAKSPAAQPVERAEAESGATVTAHYCLNGFDQSSPQRPGVKASRCAGRGGRGIDGGDSPALVAMSGGGVVSASTTYVSGATSRLCATAAKPIPRGPRKRIVIQKNVTRRSFGATKAATPPTNIHHKRMAINQFLKMSSTWSALMRLILQDSRPVRVE